MLIGTAIVGSAVMVNGGVKSYNGFSSGDNTQGSIHALEAIFGAQNVGTSVSRFWRIRQRANLIRELRAPKTGPAAFADEAAEIMENAARSRGLNPNSGIKAMAAPIREVELSKLVPPPTRPFADPAKLQRHGPFDMSLYKPIQVEDLGGGRYMIMDGMTRMENARRAGMTKLPVQIFPKSGQ